MSDLILILCSSVLEIIVHTENRCIRSEIITFQVTSKEGINIMKSNNPVVYTLATLAGLCFVSGIVILSK